VTQTLVVVGTLTEGVLSTDVPVPTDGQPTWWRCSKHRRRFRDHCPWGTLISSPKPVHDVAADGPFPFTLAVWQETHMFCADPTTWNNGAVVATVTMTGPSHYADECRHGRYSKRRFTFSDLKEGTSPSYCHPDAVPDRWHTPVGEVSWFDPPRPMERPILPSCDNFAPSWWADVEAPTDA